ncbi:hypothetical protein J1N35_007739 [Gossypium stocksii]|uniref:Amino acid transporter transmembrane domain-containing protein n=1 Tax=Gossypium stocksii TaxID=47602 RepID=A0A9D4AFY4_9ROSI|nr:hypothetical protein J1N35_007739 [Gossypium stocksii]
MVFCVTGYTEGSTIRIKDNEKGNIVKGWSDDFFLHVMWLYGLCCFWRLIPCKLTHSLLSTPFCLCRKNGIRDVPGQQIHYQRYQDLDPWFSALQSKPFQIGWRTCFVMITTLISMLLPFFNDIVGLLGALGFWPLTVYFPVEMYISQKKIPKWSTTWLCLQVLSIACLIITIAAAAGSIAGIVLDLKSYTSFSTGY